MKGPQRQFQLRIENVGVRKSIILPGGSAEYDRTVQETRKKHKINFIAKKNQTNNLKLKSSQISYLPFHFKGRSMYSGKCQMIRKILNKKEENPTFALLSD